MTLYAGQCASCHGAELQGNRTGNDQTLMEFCLPRLTTRPGTLGTMTTIFSSPKPSSAGKGRWQCGAQPTSKAEYPDWQILALMKKSGISWPTLVQHGFQRRYDFRPQSGSGL
ncbi:hypothetical protein [Ruegeria hyattellae]|uniref:hypothetical protein n=1 Tax=Ruegeria hyattellae TaxID=3233337 RepID=UPI00355B25FC